MPLLDGFVLKTPFSIFPLFWVNQKGVFWIFLKMGNLYGFEHENHSEQVHNMWPYELTWKEQLFLTFWKNMVFPVCDST